MVGADEIIVDSFAGGGGASTGIGWALGRSPDIAIDHDPEALALHEANHPATRHLCESIYDVDPRVVCAGRRVGLLWASPDCTHFSKARGGKPARKEIRSLAWVVCRWAKEVRPRVICVENVEEFVTWGPLGDDGRPCPRRRGVTFRAWVARLRNLGYAVDWRELRACDYGAPTSRKRLFVVARCDGEPITWPERTHGPRRDLFGLLPYRTAAECIDWTIPCPSIFERKKPLADATLRRIARGVMRYVVGAAEPFIVPLTHHGETTSGHSIGEPLRTVTGAHRGEIALVAPTLVQTGYGERPGQTPRALDLHAPLGTVVGGGAKHALVAAFLARHYGGHENDGAPMHTITTQDHHHLVTARLGKAHSAEVRAFLIAYYNTDQRGDPRQPRAAVTSHDRFGLVMVRGDVYEIADIGMRMLAPRELYRAQGFPGDYRIDVEFSGKPLSKTAQVRMCGNSVCPPAAEALVRAQFAGCEQAAAGD